MDDKTILAGFKSARRRSKLEPHKKLIFKLLRKGATVREIAHTLSEKRGLKVDQSTVSRFIVRWKQLDQEHTKTKPRREKPHNEAAPLTMPAVPARPSTAKPAPRDEEALRRIEAPKQKPVNQDPPKRFSSLIPTSL
jgi:hypothetical protein